MKFIKGIFIVLILANLFIHNPLLATDSFFDEDSQSEDYLSPEEREERKSLGKKIRKKIKIKQLDRLLGCASSLIEYQFGGNASSLRGIKYIDRASKRLKRQNYHYRDLTKRCKHELRDFKINRRQGKITEGLMSNQTRDNYLFRIKSKFPYNRNLIDIANKALNEKITCRTAFGIDFKVGFIVSLSVGWNHYTCTTPLGRRYHITGPNAGIGLGIGAILDLSVAERTTFSALLNSRSYKILMDDAQAWAIVAGKGKTLKNNEEKSSDITLGLGLYTMQRGHFMIKIKRSPKFENSGLYELVGVPKEAHY